MRWDEKLGGYVMEIAEFEEMARHGSIIDDDGIGYYVIQTDNELIETEIEAIPSEIRDGRIERTYTHIIWYTNRKGGIIMICKIANKNGKVCPGIKFNHCSIYFDEGVIRRNETGICQFRDIRLIETKKQKKKINPLKASKKGGE